MERELVEKGEVTELLLAARSGAPDAMDRLATRVYDDLRRIAHRQLRAERDGHTLGTTGVVHEAWMRLVDRQRVQWNDRAQFFALAARMMRRVLVDYARRYEAHKRGGGRQRVDLGALDASTRDTDSRAEAADPADPTTGQRAETLIALDEALRVLERDDPRAARVVELRYFAGLTEVEVAELLGVTERTVRRDWAKARERLYAEVQRALA